MPDFPLRRDEGIEVGTELLNRAVDDQAYLVAVALKSLQPDELVGLCETV